MRITYTLNLDLEAPHPIAWSLGESQIDFDVAIRTALIDTYFNRYSQEENK